MHLYQRQRIRIQRCVQARKPKLLVRDEKPVHRRVEGLAHAVGCAQFLYFAVLVIVYGLPVLDA